MKYTKEKWAFSPQTGTKGHCLMAQVWDDDGNPIAVIDDTLRPEQATARAKLISKAPEMYEAIKGFIIAIEDGSLTVYTDDEHNAVRDENEEKINKLYSLIKEIEE